MWMLLSSSSSSSSLRFRSTSNWRARFQFLFTWAVKKRNWAVSFYNVRYRLDSKLMTDIKKSQLSFEMALMVNWSDFMYFVCRFLFPLRVKTLWNRSVGDAQYWWVFFIIIFFFVSLLLLYMTLLGHNLVAISSKKVQVNMLNELILPNP